MKKNRKLITKQRPNQNISVTHLWVLTHQLRNSALQCLQYSNRPNSYVVTS